MTTAQSTNPFLTIPEVAAILGCSPMRAYQLAADGVFPSVRLTPRRIRVPRDALDRWLEEQNERALGNVRSGEGLDP
jgi:excisionase family DNA binding protein